MDVDRSRTFSGKLDGAKQLERVLPEAMALGLDDGRPDAVERRYWAKSRPSLP
jgi:hypothetical protein